MTATLGQVTRVRVHFVGDPDPTTLEPVSSVQVLLVDPDTGRVAEVQVAYVGGSLVVIAAGQVLADRDTRGFARLRIDPE